MAAKHYFDSLDQEIKHARFVMLDAGHDDDFAFAALVKHYDADAVQQAYDSLL
jgi:hypothetical protein